jgi:DNA repair protein SbcD/Mre11
MRLLHTSDWHLGHLLLDLPREREHQAFLAWLLDVLEAERIDALLVTGDVFDAGNPPATAQAAWFGFLAEAHRRRPAMTTVVIAGNHDSPGRLVAPAPLMAGVRTHVVGQLPRVAGGALDASRVVVPLPRADGTIAAWAVAVPFLRPGDLHDDTPEAVRAVYAEALGAARARREAGQAIVAMGHLHLSGGEPSWMSERRVTVGGVEALDGRGFGDDVAYVALGHLHKAQRVGAEHVRYAGSPIPLAMGEADYVHSVVVVELDGERAGAVRTVPVPRAVELRRVPRVAAPLPEVLAAIAALDVAAPGDDRELAPYVEVKVRLAAPEPHLRTQIEQAMRGKRARLVKISPELTGDRLALADAPPPESLAELDPREVLRRRWRRDHQDDVPAEVMAAFEQLLVDVGAAR